MLSKKQFLIISLALAFALTGCTAKNDLIVKQPISKAGNKAVLTKSDSKVPTSLEEKIANQSRIHKFESLEEIREFLEENETTENVYGYGRGMMVDDMVFDSIELISESTKSAPAMSKEVANAGSDDYSKTNVQVEGVDEADIIKTDGKHIFALVKNSLYVIDAYPANNMNILSKIEFKSRPQDIYINDGKLVVFGYDNDILERSRSLNFIRRNSFTFVKVFDLSDPKKPTQVRDLDLEGTYTNSRMIGDYVYFITTSYNHYYIDNEPVLPRILEDGNVIPNACSGNEKCFVPDVYYFDMPYSSYNFTSITAVNIADNSQDVTGDVYLLSSGQNIYSSLSNMYITYTKYLSEYELEMEMTKEMVLPKLSEKDREKVGSIEAVENYILSPQEKQNKVLGIIQRHIQNLPISEQEKLENELEIGMRARYEDISKELEKTVIHKIAINKGDLEYVTYGEVTGHVLNQFSMDESEGYFRIATTKNRNWSRFSEVETKSYNNMYILDENLEIVGGIEGLAQDERIYSVRFMQDRAYMVTFKQTDPLFVIDLSTPSDPIVLGELKIPGFSSYLHPYDKNTLIGIGKDTEEKENGRVITKGIKISLFDVSDVKDPKEADTYVLGDSGSDSIALNDHKAFLFSREKNLMVIPATTRETINGVSGSRTTFSGGAVFSITADKIELRGRIDHNSENYVADTDYWMGYNYYDNTVKRSLYIDDVLYTFSNNFIKANDLKDLSEIKDLELKMEKETKDFEIYN